MSFRNNIPRVTKITFGVFKFLFGVIVNTSGETISTSYIGCKSLVPMAYEKGLPFGSPSVYLRCMRLFHYYLTTIYNVQALLSWLALQLKSVRCVPFRILQIVSSYYMDAIH